MIRWSFRNDLQNVFGRVGTVFGELIGNRNFLGLGQGHLDCFRLRRFFSKVDQWFGVIGGFTGCEFASDRCQVCFGNEGIDEGA